jgi:hypothetical protein
LIFKSCIGFNSISICFEDIIVFSRFFKSSSKVPQKVLGNTPWNFLSSPREFIRTSWNVLKNSLITTPITVKLLKNSLRIPQEVLHQIFNVSRKNMWMSATSSTS